MCVSVTKANSPTKSHWTTSGLFSRVNNKIVNNPRVLAPTHRKNLEKTQPQKRQRQKINANSQLKYALWANIQTKCEKRDKHGNGLWFDQPLIFFGMPPIFERSDHERDQAFTPVSHTGAAKCLVSQ